MRTRLVPIIAQINTVLQEHNASLTPLTQEETEAIHALMKAKNLLTFARAKLQQADLHKEESNE